MDGGAWQAAVHGVAKSQTRVSDFTFTFHFHVLEEEMATHSSVLAWRIPGTGEPGGLPSLGSHRVGNEWKDLAAAAARGRGYMYTYSWVPGGLDGKESVCNAGNPGLIPGSGRPVGEGNGNPLQYYCLEKSMVEQPGGLQSVGSQRVGHDWVIKTFTFHFRSWFTLWCTAKTNATLQSNILQ